jgi:hypothetical protein
MKALVGAHDHPALRNKPKSNSVRGIAGRKFLVPWADSLCSGATSPGSFAAETALIPLRTIVRNEREFGGEYPPFALKRQVSTTHFG